MVGRILLPEIQSLIDARNFTALRELFSEMPPADVAEIILDLPEDEQVIIFRILPHVAGRRCLRVSRCRGRAARTASRHGARAGRLHSERNVAGRSHRAARGTAERGRAAIHPPPHPGGTPRRASAARLSGGKRWTFDDAGPDRGRCRVGRCSEVLDYVREHGQDRETLNVIYVVDDRGKLIDDMRIREFLLRPLDDQSERHDGSKISSR